MNSACGDIFYLFNENKSNTSVSADPFLCGTSQPKIVQSLTSTNTLLVH